MDKHNDNDGFTLVELMLSLAFFSFILMFVLSGFLLITRNYNQGVTSSRIHQAGRNTLEQMVRELRQSTVAPQLQAAGSDVYLCYSGGTYRAVIEQDPDNPNSGLLQRTNQNLTDNCNPAAFSVGVAEDVLDVNEVAVTNLALDFPAGPTNELFQLDIALASANITDSELGTDTDSDGENDSCSVATSGSEFCDIVTLSTVFTTR